MKKFLISVIFIFSSLFCASQTITGTKFVLRVVGLDSVYTDTTLAAAFGSNMFVTANISKLLADSTYNLSSSSFVSLTGAYSNPSWITALSYSKLTGAPSLATVATTGTYSDLSGKPSLSSVAISGSYADLSGKPTLSTVATSGVYSDLSGRPSLATVSTSGDYTDLINKPTLFSGSYTDLTSKPTLFSGSYSDLTGKPTLFSGVYSDLSGKPTFATVATSGVYSDLSGKPSLSTVATTGSYNDLINLPSLFSGAYTDLTGKPTLFSGSYLDLSNTPTIPVAQIQSDWNQTDTTLKDYIKNKPTLTSGTVTNVSGTSNRITSSGGATPILDISSTFEGLLGKVANPLSQFSSTSSSQLAGVISDETGTGNIVFSNSPSFTTPNIGTATGSISGNSGTSTALQTARTINSTSFDGTSNITITASPSGSAGGSLSGTFPNPTIVNSGVTSGTYFGVVVVGSDGRITSASNPTKLSLSNTDRVLNTAYQISTTAWAEINVSSKVSCALSLSGGQTGSIILEVSSNGTTGWTYVGQVDGSNTGTLTLGLSTAQVSGGAVKSTIQPGYYWRLRTSGTGTFSFSGGEQITY